MSGMHLLYFLAFIVLPLPVTSLIAWNLPRSFSILLVSLTSCTCLVVPVALLLRLRYYGPGDPLTPYLRYDNIITWLLAATWIVLTALPALWLRQGRRVSRGKIVALLMALIATAAWSNRPFYPTAKLLRANFREHRAIFERLAMMACEDMPADVNSFIEGIRGFSQGVTHFSPVRLATYRRLLHEVGLTPLDVEAQGNLSLLTLNSNMSIGYDRGTIGYEYSCATIAMNPLVPSLDVPGHVRQKRYEALAPHWYLWDYNLGPDAL
jgi:hypothetical protein